MVLLKDGNLTDDTFTDVSQMDTLPASGAILVSLTQWQEHCEELKLRAGRYCSAQRRETGSDPG